MLHVYNLIYTYNLHPINFAMSLQVKKNNYIFILLNTIKKDYLNQS